MNTKKEKLLTFTIVMCGFFTMGISDLIWIYILSDKVDPIRLIPMKQLALTLVTFGIYGIIWSNRISGIVFDSCDTKREKVLLCTLLSFIFRNVSLAVIYNGVTSSNNEITGE